MTSLNTPNKPVLLRVSDEINAALEKHFWLLSVLFVVLFLACTIARDVRTPMWNDELFTLHTAQQAGTAEITKAILDGCDGAPPLYDLIVHAILPVVRNDALAVRLPSSLAFCAMLLCLLAFCRRRLTAAYSMAAVLLVCNVCLSYSAEGRCYGAVLGCSAGALLCWQSVIEGRRRILTIPLLALCVALMTALHYYSIFFLGPLFLAEMARWKTSRKLDWGVLVAAVPVLLVLGLHHPFIVAAAPFQKHFWSPAVWQRLPAFFYKSHEGRLNFCVFPAGLLAIFSVISDDRHKNHSIQISPVWTGVGAFSLMPLCVYILSIYTTHAFVSRYVIWAVPGIAVLLVALFCKVVRAQAAVGVGLLGLMVTITALSEARYLHMHPVLLDGEAMRQALASLPDDSEPIVVGDAHMFMELSYYETPRLRDRLICPVSADLDLRYFGFDTDALLMTALSHHSNLQIVDYDAVLATHPRFILAARQKDYLPWYLVTAGYRVVPINSSMPPLLYEVEAPTGKQ